MKKTLILLFFILFLFVICFKVEAHASSLYDSFVHEFGELGNLTEADNEVINSFLKNEDYVDFLSDEPCITFVAPGIGENLPHLGISGSNIQNNTLGDYFIRRNCDVYYDIYYYTNIKEDDKIVDVKDYVMIETKDEQQVYNSGISKRDPDYEYVDVITSNSIVVFLESKFNNEGHAIYTYVDGVASRVNDYSLKMGYYSIEQLVNMFIYKYMSALNKNGETLYIPRINMIGHSRGGIINMQYAIEHPNIVDSLYSVGTPYNGSNIADAMDDMGHPIDDLNMVQLINNIIEEDMEIDSDDYDDESGFAQISFDNDAIRDCINSDSYDGLKYFWNEYQESDSLYHTKLYAIGASVSYDYFINLFDTLIGNIKESVESWLDSKFGDLFADFKHNINLELENNLDSFKNLINDLTHEEMHIDYLEENQRCEINAVKEKKYFKNRYYDFGTKSVVSQNINQSSLLEIRAIKFLLLGLYNSMDYDNYLNDYVIRDDLFVDLESQQADGYLNVEKFEKIFTLENFEEIISQYNYDDDKIENKLLTVSNMPAIGHNVETKDEDILNCILSNITLGTTDNGMNIKEENLDHIINYTYIGFSYEKAVNNGVLEFKKIDDEIDSVYHISPKMFDNDYTKSQKYLKNEYANSNIIADNNVNDGIIEILFSHNIEIEDGTFSGLKGQVLFEKFDPSYEIRNGDDLYTIIDGSLYKIINNDSSEYRLIKFGRSSLYTPNMNYELPEYVTSIEDYAFFCQPIKKITSNLTNDIVIGNYAFYGCNKLKFNDFNRNVTSSGNNVISNNMLNNEDLDETNGKDAFVINNALIRYSGKELKLDNYSNITYIGPNTFKNNSSCGYLLLDKNGLVISGDAFINSSINAIFVYSEPIIDGEIDSDKIPTVFSRIDVDSFGDIEINDKITIKFKLYDESIDCFEYYVPIDYNNIVETNINYSTYDTNEYDCFGFKRTTDNCLSTEVYQDIDLFKDYGKELELYYVCNNEHVFVIEDSNKEIGHYKKCINCSYMEIEEHLYTYEYFDEYIHAVTCSCGYEKSQEHIPVSTASAIDESHHRVVCSLCGESYITNHNVIEEYQLTSVGVISYIRYCDCCEYYDVLHNKTIIDMGEYHLIDGTISRDHEYTLMDYDGLDIMVCLYCGHHEHNGLIGSSNDDYSHNLYCYFCQSIEDVLHQFSNYISISTGLESGYHSKECTACGEIVYEYHSYIEDSTYNDGHHYICMFCGDTAIYCHDESNLVVSTEAYHPVYCEICEYFYNESHNFSFYDTIESDEDGHYVICDDCGYIKKVNHNFVLVGNMFGHFYRCSDCGFESETETHTLVECCLGSDPYNHYLYCDECNYRYSAPLEYVRIAEYNHYVICALCNVRMQENHHEHCIIYDEYLHIYTCLVCDVNYEMPHFVNDHIMIYENFEPGYDLWVCTYCGYTEIRRH